MFKLIIHHDKPEFCYQHQALLATALQTTRHIKPNGNLSAESIPIDLTTKSIIPRSTKNDPRCWW